MTKKEKKKDKEKGGGDAGGSSSKKQQQQQQLPEPLETQRHYVICGPDQNSHVSVGTHLVAKSVRSHTHLRIGNLREAGWLH